MPVKETAADVTVPTSSEQKLHLSSSASSVVTESLPAVNDRKRRLHCDDHSTRESSPGSERGSRGGLPVSDRLLRDRTVSVTDRVDDRSTRESSPVSERGSRGGGGGSQNIERALRDCVTSVGERGSVKECLRLKRDVNSGTVSSSASTCSEDSELRINDFLGKTNNSLR